jgi:uncharacterized protein (TIGR02996 family)
MPLDTHPEWELLLKAVVADRDDDLPRLVAADWLDEHDQPERAEFIRVQVERVRNDRPELAWREKALLDNPLFGPLWAVEDCPVLVRMTDAGASIRDLSLNGTERVTFRRGFPFRLKCPAAEWLAHGHRTVPRQPLEELVLTRCEQVPIERWWEALDTLRPLRTLSVDFRSSTRPAMLQEQLPHTRVSANGVSAPTLLLGDTRSPSVGHAYPPVPSSPPPTPRTLLGDTT